jgi:hypothetical protein
LSWRAAEKATRNMPLIGLVQLAFGMIRDVEVAEKNRSRDALAGLHAAPSDVGTDFRTKLECRLLC